MEFPYILPRHYPILTLSLPLSIYGRIYITKGIVQLLWKELTPQIFEYSANCDMRGRIFNAALRHAKFSQGGAHTKKLKGQETAPADIGKSATSYIYSYILTLIDSYLSHLYTILSS